MSHLEIFGCHVEFQTEIMGFEQREDGVSVQLKKINSDRTETDEELEVAYLVGSDGARGSTPFSLSKSFLIFQKGS